MATAAPERCPSCGAERPAGAPLGLCPRCLLRGGLDSGAMSLSDAGELGATVDLSASPSVLERLDATVGPVPRVFLRDTEPATGPEPMLRPCSAEMPAPADRGPRLRLLGEIARGGMGAVLKGRDEDLGRDLAVKVLLDKHRDHPDLIRRFIEEAQIGGQLQHPGIVPIYELGAFADRRPYFAMKLVKGRTLAELLAARPSPSDGLARFLGIFEQVCQTVAYAHDRGVIHRDLKPSNVMVGSFGEVQVMDWGLAKVLDRGGVADDRTAGLLDDAETLISTARSGSDSDSDLSRAGSILGTPAYMAPEQARGEIDLIDERADVFALGSILCEILTGSPAFTGRTSAEIQRLAARANTADALSRLDSCGTDAELITLGRSCLAADPADRPRDARVVADRVTSHLVGVQERLHAAERERAVAEARVAEERKRRRLQVGLAASLLALSVVGGLSFTYALHQRQAEAARVDRLLAEATLLRDQALAQPDDVARWERARDALARIADDLGDAVPAALVTLGRQVESDLDDAEADRALLEKLIDIRSAQADDPDGSATDAAYADAFATAGIDPDALDPTEAGARIARRPRAVARALVASLDQWAAVRREKDAGGPGWTRVLAVARAADPDPDRDALREALLIEDKGERLDRLRPLAERADAESWAPASLVLLGDSLADAGDVEAGVAVLRRASGAHPQDARVHHTLGQLLDRVRPPRGEEVIRAYSIARGLQPELAAHDLAHALENRGRGEEAEAVWRDLVRRRLDNGLNLSCYGRHLNERGRDAEATPVLERAITASRAAIRLRPDLARAHYNLGLALMYQRKLDGAIAAFGEAIRLDPDFAEAHHKLGDALSDQGKLAEAIASYREAIRINPGNAENHACLGTALSGQGKLDEAIAAFREAIRLGPDDAKAHNGLGVALSGQGKLDEAIASYREAIRLKPDFARAHSNVGAILCDMERDYPAAEAAFREAIRLNPKLAGAHFNLGNALSGQGKHAEAIASYREAIRLDPDHAMVHVNFGIAVHRLGRPDEAAAAYREAIRLDPDLAGAHVNLGLALRGQGKLDEAIAAFREAIRLDPDLAETHNNLGEALWAQRKHDEAVAAYREAIRLKPDLASAYLGLVEALQASGDRDEAIAASREFIRRFPELDGEIPLYDLLRMADILRILFDDASVTIPIYQKIVDRDPRHPYGHGGLGMALKEMGLFDEALVHLRVAIRLLPSYPWAHFAIGEILVESGDTEGALAAFRKAADSGLPPGNYHGGLGRTLKAKGDLDGAVAALRKAVDLAPTSPELRLELGETLIEQGRYTEAIEVLQHVREITSEDPVVLDRMGRSIEEADRLRAVADRLPVIQEGREAPADDAELIDLARVCHHQGHYTAAARFWAEVLKDDRPADAPAYGHRVTAARSAVLAGLGHGQAPPADDPERQRLRRQAFDWLRAALSVWSERLADESASSLEVGKALRPWRSSSDLAGVRDPDALASLPEDERADWEALWNAVSRLLEDASGAP